MGGAISGMIGFGMKKRDIFYKNLVIQIFRDHWGQFKLFHTNRKFQTDISYPAYRVPLEMN